MTGHDEAAVSEPAFDAEWYATTYPDCLATRMAPSEHYAKIGRMLGRAPGPAEPRPARRAGLAKVSVLCITYNHEKYIEATLDGFCRQKTDFPVEFIVADDCSTDGTQAIIRRYAAKDPRIVPILHQKNLGVAGNFASAAARAQGEYVALCEGDDYWTDSSKLQRQADQLDADRDLAVVFHPVEVFNDSDGRLESIYPDKKPDLTIWELTYVNYIQTNSVMYRWRFRGGLPDWFDTSILPLDWYLHLCHAEIGSIGYLSRVMAKYRKHDGGIWSSAATDPIQLRRRYGPQQLRMFRAVSKVAAGMFSDHLDATFDYLLTELYIDALVCESEERMGQLAGEFHADLVRLKLVPDQGAAGAGAIAPIRISVVVLTYNHAQYIAQCLESVLRQQGPFELEIIVGDDHSPDDTLDRVRQIAQQHPGITVLSSETNIGMLANMKRCLAACTGEFIAFCEGDDYWLGTRKLIRQVAQMKRDPRLALSFNWVLLEHELDGRMEPHPQQAEWNHEHVPTAVIARNPLTANFSCCLYRAAAVRTVPDSYFEQKGNADWKFNMHVAEWGGIAFLRETHSVYRLHSKGQWTGMTTAAQNEQFDLSRRKCSQEFGYARGFDDYRVVCQVTRSTDPELARFAFGFDDLVDGRGQELESGCLRVAGWAIDRRGSPLKIRIGKGEGALVGKLDVRRDDRSRRVGKGTRAFHSPMCGFDLRRRFDLAESELDIYILCGGREYRIAKLEPVLSFGKEIDPGRRGRGRRDRGRRGK